MKYDREAGHFRVKFIELVLLRMQKKKKKREGGEGEKKKGKKHKQTIPAMHFRYCSTFHFPQTRSSVQVSPG